MRKDKDHPISIQNKKYKGIGLDHKNYNKAHKDFENHLKSLIKNKQAKYYRMEWE